MCSKRANLAQVKVIIFHQRDSDTRKTCEDLEPELLAEGGIPMPQGQALSGLMGGSGTEGRSGKGCSSGTKNINLLII